MKIVVAWLPEQAPISWHGCSPTSLMKKCGNEVAAENGAGASGNIAQNFRRQTDPDSYTFIV